MFYSDIKEIVHSALLQIKNFDSNFEKINILPINSNISGHYCSNLLFENKFSNEEKEKLKECLLKNKLIEKVEVIKGYLNLTLKGEYFQKKNDQILNEEILPNIGKREKTNVEFCSVNPTGYLHIGHARNAILGDSIARILEKTNYDVTKEYYVNDGGNQINLMAESIYARLCELKNIHYKFPENGYKGSEMQDVAQTLKKDATIDEIKKIAVNFFVNEIKNDLKNININHDIWIYESTIIKEKYIEKALKILEEKGYIENNTREEKKVSKGKISKNALTLLKTTLLGDDQDRPLTKSDGSWTYFAPDIGYHFYKIERGFSFLVCTLGADHDSYANRIKIATKLLDNKIKHYTPICQMVSFEHDGSLVKFSKRMGNSIRIQDFIKEISPDILRFMILEKSADTQFVFNYESAVNVTLKNPVFYCQYAFARGCSILRKAENLKTETINEKSVFFEKKEVQDFIITMSSFDSVLRDSTKDLAPHKLANYTKKLCEKMHKLWQIGKIDENDRIILEKNPIETETRIKIIKSFLKIAKECFYCLGINAKEKME
ncbi:arginine--tRNA ligase [Alphaproteobacteria bacterium endosymbiont of Tiliacea citrago]|uniref:arginine--tRNA ligase n=1 Tax=Alphaproteobacteria bacterium endosymbiont of Tiliacea citrago TaxID=3077944 RepID=UPI00313C103E